MKDEKEPEFSRRCGLVLNAPYWYAADPKSNDYMAHVRELREQKALLESAIESANDFDSLSRKAKELFAKCEETLK